MQIFLRQLCGRIRTWEVDQKETILCLKHRLLQELGGAYNARELRLIYDGLDLVDDKILGYYRMKSKSVVDMGVRLRGGYGMKIVVFPRIQYETWSLAWKETSEVETKCLDPIVLNIDEQTTIEQVERAVAKQLGWQPVTELLSLEGFDGQWERSIYKGRLLQKTKTIKECNISPNTTLYVVRRHLIAEGFRIVIDEDDVETTDEEEDFKRNEKKLNRNISYKPCYE